MATADLLSTDLGTGYALENRPRNFPLHDRSGMTLTTHYFWLAFQWTGLLFLMGALLFVAEWLLGIAYTSRGMATEPLHLVARVMGFAHYTIATYFLVTSKKIRNVRGMLILLLFIGIAVALCMGLSHVGGYKNRVAFLSVGILFLIHGLRDETFFYRMRSGKALSDSEYPYVYKMLIWAQFAGLAIAASLLYPVYIYGSLTFKGHHQVAEFIDPAFPAGLPLMMKAVAVGLPFAMIGVVIAAWIHRLHPGGLIQLLKSHRPFSIILATYLGFALLSVVGSAGVLFVLILVHFVGWFVFAANSIAAKPKEVQQAATWRTPDKWIRENLTGFLVFHTGLIALFFGLIALNHWGLNAQQLTVMGADIGNPFTLMLDKNAFVYWTVVHLVLAFMPKPAAKRR